MDRIVTEWMGLGFSYIASNVAWRLFLGLQHLPPIMLAVCVPLLPEVSPRDCTELRCEELDNVTEGISLLPCLLFSTTAACLDTSPNLLAFSHLDS
jgi:hypothetical protein